MEPTAFDELLKQQQDLNNEKKARLEEELAQRLQSAPANIDWSPLAAQLDSLYGGQATQQAAQSALAQGNAYGQRTKELEDQLNQLGENQFKISLAAEEKKAERAYKADEKEKDRAAKVASGGDKAAKQNFDDANKLRDDFTKSDIVKEYNKAGEGIAKLRELSKSPTQGGANDVALIYAFMKAQDPGSVVREGEYATAQKYAGSLFDSYGIKLDRLLGKKDVLSPEQRASLVNAAESGFKSQQANYDNLSSQYAELAKAQGVDPKHVVVGVRIKDAPEQKVKAPISLAERAKAALAARQKQGAGQ